MIEINLSPKTSKTDLTNVGGFNLSLLNVKLLVIAFVILYVPQPILESFYDDKIQEVETEMTILRGDFRKITSRVKELDDIQRQIDQLSSLEKKLEAKIDVVKKIVNKRQNPFKVLKYVAENTPGNLWVTKMELNNSNLKMIGYSMNWQIIGEFIESLKQSVFFDRDIKYSEPTDLDKKFEGKTLHTFEINTTVVSFQ